jgi:hypothetical protein
MFKRMSLLQEPHLRYFAAIVNAVTPGPHM